MSSRNTKSPRARTPKAATPLSPTRITRMEEKLELQDLNKRLEFYILKNREKDATQDMLQREIDEVRFRAEQERAEFEREYDQQLEDLRKQKDEEKAANNRAQNDLKRLQSELEGQKRELGHLRDTEARLRADNDELQEQLSAKTVEAAQLKNANDKLKSDYATLQDKVTDLEVTVDNLTNSEQAANERADEAESKLEALASGSNAAGAKAQNELKRLRSQVDELKTQNNRIEEELRTELTTQLSNILEQRQAEWEHEKNDGLAELKAIYDEKIQTYRDHLERAGHELAALKERMSNAEAEAKETKASYEEFEVVKVTMKKRIDELEEAVRAEKTRPARQLAEKIEIIRRLKAAFKRKDEEFDELMDVKIALAMEIKAYREMLEKEENRLGYKSPGASKKRKLVNQDIEASGAGASSSSSSSMHVDKPKSQDEKTILRFSAVDVHGKSLTIRNNSTDDVSLDGWSLRSQKTGSALQLPGDVSLKPGQSVTIWTGEDAAEHHSPPNDIAWEAEGSVWDEANGDEAELIDPSENIHNVVGIIPENLTLPEDGEGMDESATGAGGDQQKCLIM